MALIVNYKKYNPKAKEPIKYIGRDFAFDVYATSKEDLGNGVIRYGIGLGLQIEKKTNSILSIRAISRSSIYKTGLILSNSCGIIDEEYTGEISFIFYHIIKQLPAYEIGDRIGQIYIQATTHLEFKEVEKLKQTTRGGKGYGSTGNN